MDGTSKNLFLSIVGTNKLKKGSLHNKDSLQTSKNVLWNKGEYQNRSCTSTKKTNMMLHGCLQKIGPNPYTPQSRRSDSTLPKCNGKPHNVSKVYQYITKSVLVNKNLNAHNLLQSQETKSRQDFVRHEISNSSTQHEIRSMQKRSRQAYRNAAQQLRQTSQQTANEATAKKSHVSPPVVTTCFDKSISRSRMNSVSEGAVLFSEASPLHHVKDSQSAAHKTPQSNIFNQ
jgi:hypothetical protein